jgi:hypothetical protein
LQQDRKVLERARDILEESNKGRRGRVARRGLYARTIRDLEMILRPPLPPALPRHRPGETPWLKPVVLKLAALLHGHGASVSTTYKVICEALKLSGHDDVVTQESVRHILRTEHAPTLSEREPGSTGSAADARELGLSHLDDQVLASPVQL